MTREQLHGCLPSLENINALFNPNQNDEKDLYWVVLFDLGDFTNDLEVKVRLVVGRGVYSFIKSSGSIAAQAHYFMEQDFENHEIHNFLERLKSLANNLEYQYRAMLRANQLMK